MTITTLVTPALIAKHGPALSNLIDRVYREDLDDRQLDEMLAGVKADFAAAVRKKSDIVRHLVAKVASGKCTEQELIELHANNKLLGCTRIMAAVESQMRNQFPRAAKRLFGKTVAFTTQLLQEVCVDLATRVDLSSNRVKNGVKVGGEALSGRKKVNEYISYRAPNGAGAYLSLEQDADESELVAVLGVYQVGAAGYRSEATFNMAEFGNVAVMYTQYVERLAA